MPFQPIDLASLLQAVMWPIVVGLAITVFRAPIGAFAAALPGKIRKLSVASFAIELEEMPEVKPSLLEVEIRPLDAAPQIQSGPESISGILDQLQGGGKRTYLVVDLGATESPRWISSRLYLLSFLMTLIDYGTCLAFVESGQGFRRRFVGVAMPDDVRWALATQQGWLESAMATALAFVGGAICSSPGGVIQCNPVSSFQLDQATRRLKVGHVGLLMQHFLSNIRKNQPDEGHPSATAARWIPVSQGMHEHANWLDGYQIERLLGDRLSVASATLPTNGTVADLRDAVLGQSDRFVAIVDLDRKFRGLIDRTASLESLGRAYLKQARE